MLEIASELGRRIGELLIEQLMPPFFSVTSPLFWTHIASALVLALLVHVVADRGARARSLSAFVRRYLPARVLWHPSARADYLFYVANGVVFPLLLAPHLIGDAAVRDAVELRILGVFGPAAERGAPGVVATAAFTLLVFVAFDFGRWVGHLAMHRVPADLVRFTGSSRAAERSSPCPSESAPPERRAQAQERAEASAEP